MSLEPAAGVPGNSDTETALLSLAISMKRIADMLEGAKECVPYALSEHHLWLLGQSFERGKLAS